MPTLTGHAPSALPDQCQLTSPHCEVPSLRASAPGSARLLCPLCAGSHLEERLEHWLEQQLLRHLSVVSGPCLKGWPCSEPVAHQHDNTSLPATWHAVCQGPSCVTHVPCGLSCRPIFPQLSVRFFQRVFPESLLHSPYPRSLPGLAGLDAPCCTPAPCRCVATPCFSPLMCRIPRLPVALWAGHHASAADLLARPAAHPCACHPGRAAPCTRRRLPASGAGRGGGAAGPRLRLAGLREPRVPQPGGRQRGGAACAALRALQVGGAGARGANVLVCVLSAAATERSVHTTAAASLRSRSGVSLAPCLLSPCSAQGGGLLRACLPAGCLGAP